MDGRERGHNINFKTNIGANKTRKYTESEGEREKEPSYLIRSENIWCALEGGVWQSWWRRSRASAASKDTGIEDDDGSDAPSAAAADDDEGSQHDRGGPTP